MLKWTVQAGLPAAMEPPPPRLCHLRKWAHFQGYGFNLHTDRSKESQLVGNVDEGSPADAAGVKKGDKIIEVNGTNISNENHTQVVARIKAGGEETRILVADKDCVEWHLEQGHNISSSLSYVLHLSSERPPASPAPSSSSSSSSSSSVSEEEPVRVVESSPPAAVQPIVEEDEGVELEEEKGEEEETRPTSPPPAPAPAPAPVEQPPSPSSSSSSSESESESDEEVASPSSPAGSPAMRAPPAGKEASSSDSEPEQEQNRRRRQESTSSEEEEVKPRSFGTQASKTSVTSTGSSRFSYKKDELVAGLQLNMTAAEMRARVSRNKKPDPRTDKIDLKQKAAIIRNM